MDEVVTSLSLPKSSVLTLLHDTLVTLSPGPLQPVSALGVLGLAGLPWPST